MVRALIVLSLAIAVAAIAARAHGEAQHGSCSSPDSSQRDASGYYDVSIYGANGIGATDRNGRGTFSLPSVDDNVSDLDNPDPSVVQELLVDPPADDTYAVELEARKTFPVQLSVARQVNRPDGRFVDTQIASWFLPAALPTGTQRLWFATGRSVATAVLCLDGRSLQPTSVVLGAAARDDAGPRISAAVSHPEAGKARVTVHAIDAGSGVAGIWFTRRGGPAGRLSVYTGPVDVRRGDWVVAYAVDRAGNMSTDLVKTA
jgi:hypothetical protein